MRFVCSNTNFDLIDRAAIELNVEGLTVGNFVDLADDRLIGIARLLGMEELAPAISNEEAMRRLGIEGIITPKEAMQWLGSEEIVTPAVFSPAPENGNGMPLCEICGKPVQSKRHKTCSKECLDEKQRRYAREYYHRKDKTTEDAGGGDPSPLHQVEEETFSIREWGSDPGDEPVRVAGL